MPLLDVEIVLRAGETLRPGLAGALARAAGEALGSAPGSVWVRLRSLPRERYAENGGDEGASVHPVFVSVLRAASCPEPELEEETRRLTRAVAAACDRPEENVHVIHEPPGAGRVAFGGVIVKR